MLGVLKKPCRVLNLVKSIFGECGVKEKITIFTKWFANITILLPLKFLLDYKITSTTTRDRYPSIHLYIVLIIIIGFVKMNLVPFGTGS